VDVVEDFLVVVGLGEAVHVIDELARHGAPLLHLKTLLGIFGILRGLLGETDVRGNGGFQQAVHAVVS
jgi:hypothetical protein